VNIKLKHGGARKGAGRPFKKVVETQVAVIPKVEDMADKMSNIRAKVIGDIFGWLGSRRRDG
jgi:hypothetical protein